MSDYDRKLDDIVRSKLKEDYTSDYFFKPYTGDEAGIPDKYTMRDQFKLMKRVYHLDPDRIVKPLAMVSEGKSLRGFILEKIDGETLNEARLKEHFCNYRYDIAGQLEETVQKMHERGFVHGDLHSGNVMLTKSGIKLIDMIYVPKNHRSFAKYARYDDEHLYTIRRVVSSHKKGQ